MSQQPIQVQQPMNSLRQIVICFDRREKQRRKVRGILVYSPEFEPNPFSRRTGFDRRG